MELLPFVLFVIATAANTAAAILNVRATRRARRATAAVQTIPDSFARMAAYCAFMSLPESGAPQPIRDMARDALPPDTKITPYNGTVH